MTQPTDEYQAGQRVAITQQVPRQEGVWTDRVEGVVVRTEQAKTGSWYAHAKDDKLWLDRLVIRKDDGEVIVANLDPYTRVEVIG
jgi:hypothetical protein